MELSTLGIGVDSKPVDQANKKLDEFVDKAGKAERAAKGVGEGAKSGAKGFDDLEGAMTRASIKGNVIGDVIQAGVQRAVEAVKVLYNLMKQVGDYADFADMTGASAVNIAKLQTAADIAGVSMESLTGNMNQMTRMMAQADEETDKAAAALKRIGINWRDFEKLDPAERVATLGKQMALYGDSVSKTEVLQAVFGRGAGEVGKVIKALGDETIVTTMLTEEMISAVDDYNDAQAKLASQTRQWIQFVMAGATPALTAFMGAIGDSINAALGLGNQADALGANKGIEVFAIGAARLFAQVVEAGQVVWRLLEGLGSGLLSLGQAAMAVLRGDFAGVAKAFEGHASRVKEIMGRELFSKTFEKNLDKYYSDQVRKQYDAENKMTETVKAASGKRGKSRKDETDKAIQEFNTLMEAIRKRNAMNNAELAGGKALTDAEKFQIDMTEKLASAKSKLTPVQRQNIVNALAEAKAIDDLVEARKREIKAAQDAFERSEQANAERDADERKTFNQRAEFYKQMGELSQATKDEAASIELEAKMLGATAAARQLANVQLREEIWLRQQFAAIDAYGSGFDTQEQRDEAKARAMVESQRRVSVEMRKVQVDEMTKAFEQADNIAKTFFTDLLENGTSAFKNLGASLKRWFIDVLYETVVRPWVVNIVANLAGVQGGAVGAAAQAATGGAGNFLSKLIGGGGDMMNLFTNFGGSASNAAFNTGYALMNSGFEGVGTALMDNANAIGAVSNTLGYIGAGLSIFKDLKNKSWGSAVGTGIGTFFGGPIGGFIGKTVGGWVDKLFGWGKKNKVPSFGGVAGSYGEIGGNANGGDFNKFDSQMQAMVDVMTDSFKKISTALGGFAKDMQYGAYMIERNGNTRWGMRSAVTGQEIRGESANANVEADMKAAMADLIIGGLAASGVEAEVLAYFNKISSGLAGEAKLAAVEQAAMLAQVRNEIRRMGTTVAGLRTISMDATEALAGFAGGLQNLVAGVQAYRANFFSAAEQLKMGYEDLAKAMNSAGSGWMGASGDLLRSWDKNFFRKVVDGIDLTTETGQRQFATMMNMAGAFAQLEDAERAEAERARAEAEERQRQHEERVRQWEEEKRIHNEYQTIVKNNTFSLANFNVKMHEMRFANMIHIMGGMEKVTEAFSGLISNYSTRAERRQGVGRELAAAFQAEGSPWYKHLTNSSEVLKMAREDFIQIFRTIDLNSSSGQRLAAEMLRLQDAFASITEEIREPTYYTVDSALAALNQVYEEQKGKVTALRDTMKSANDAFKEFNDSMGLDDKLGTNTPSQRMSEAMRQYEEAKAAMQKDQYSQESVGRFTQIARTVLDQGRGMYASGGQYDELFESVRRDMEMGQFMTAKQMTDAERQLERMDTQIAQYQETNHKLTSIDMGIQNLIRVWQGEQIVQSTPWGARGAGLYGHATGLNFVPFDNYPAALHTGEAVLTAGEAGFMRHLPDFVGELRALRREVTQLRRENRQDAGATIGATFDATRRAAETQSEATIRAARERQHLTKKRPILA